MQYHPIGVIPKKDPGKWHTILHLSYPDGDLINFHIPEDEYSLHYVTVDKAISIIKQLGPGAWLSKVDIEEAFRIIPIHPDDWHLLGMYWEGKYYYDKRLSMGVALVHTSLTSYQLLWNGFVEINILYNSCCTCWMTFLQQKIPPAHLGLSTSLSPCLHIWGPPCNPQSCRSHSVSRISGHNLRYRGYGGKTFTRKAAEAACSFGLI